MVYINKCVVCGKEFETRKEDKETCSPSCSSSLWRKRNPQKYKEITKKYYHAHKDQINRKKREYYQKHKDQINRKKRERYHSDEEYRNKCRENVNIANKKWRDAHKEYEAERKRKWYQENHSTVIHHKVCPICGKEFNTKKSNQIYCGKECLKIRLKNIRDSKKLTKIKESEEV